MANAYANYGQIVTFTPQSRPIPGREAEMTPNNAGGYGFVLDDWERLIRFLVLGSEGGTYYVSEKNLTAQNAANVIRCVALDGPRVVAMARDVNVGNRAPKVDQQLFALALAMKHGDAATKAAVREAAPSMLRTGTHLLHFAAMLKSLGGWSRSKRDLVAEWFTERKADSVAFQVLKYQNRDGWTMRDVLRVSHPVAPGPHHNAVFAWSAGKVRPDDMAFMPEILAKHRAMLDMDGTPKDKALWGVAHGLPREALPTEALSDPDVQRAMLPDMPIHALIRNLGNLTTSKLLHDDANAYVACAKLVDRDALRRSRVHPFAILLATLVYRTGSGVRGGKAWTPVKTVLSALEDAYDAAFDNVTPTGRRILIGLDVSGSMTTHNCVGTPIKVAQAAAAMAVTLARIEPHATVVTFDTDVRDILPVTRRTGIASLASFSGGGTDLSAPIRWAARQGEKFDAFVLLSDDETWSGSRHPVQSLEAYRKQVGYPTKMVCCSMAANHVNVVDPTDPLQFGCAGLDSNLPSLVADFIGR